MFKKVLSLLLVGAMALSMTACGSSNDTSAKSETKEAVGTQTAGTEGSETSTGAGADVKQIKLAYAFANIDENNQRTMNAIKAYVEELNAAGKYNIEFIYTDSQSQMDKQIADVESLIQQKPDLINVSAVDTAGVIPCLQAVVDAGILCVDDRGSDAADIYTYEFNGFNEDGIGELKAQAMKDYLDANPEAHLNVGCIYGMAAQVLQLQRIECIKALAEDPEYSDRITILETQYGDWSTDKATSITEDWLLKYPEMNCIVTASDDMGLGAVNALNASGKKDFYVDGVDGTKIGIELCEAGTQYYVTIAANQTLIQKDWVDTALAAIDGTFTEKEYKCPASCFEIVTRDNVAEHAKVQ